MARSISARTFDALQPQCDDCKGRNYFERVLFALRLLAFLALGFPILISSCGFGFMRTSAPIRRLVSFRSSTLDFVMAIDPNKLPVIDQRYTDYFTGYG